MKPILFAVGVFIISYTSLTFEEDNVISNPALAPHKSPLPVVADKEKSLKAFQKIITVLKAPAV